MSMGTMLPPANVNCAPPPGGFATAYNDGALAGTLGCPLPAAPVQVNSASQLFERGSMIYAQETPARIYVLYNDGTFRRYDDTWVGGVDPESGGETPPAGLLEPVRGFGKVWRTNPDVRAGLGWAFTPEAGALAWIQTFERGRMIALPQRNEIIALTDDAGGAGGRWRSFVGGY
jgi:serine/threonine-protein kinase